MSSRLMAYSDYFKTSGDHTPLVLHREYALKLIEMVEKRDEHVESLTNVLEELNKYNEALILENLELKGEKNNEYRS